VYNYTREGGDTGMDDSETEGQISETTVEKHLKNALSEADPAEKNYHIRLALQHVVSEKQSRD
jgi:hypothetical protein